MEKFINNLTVNATNFGMKILGAILVFIIGRYLLNRLCVFIDTKFLKKQSDPMIRSFVNSGVQIMSFSLLAIIVASIAGIKMISLIAILSAATLAIGMALQGSLSNFAGGFLILTLRPFNLGDYIKVNNYEGTVDSIHIFYTTMNTIDNKKEIIPNGIISNSCITNYTKNGKRRVDIELGISYDEDFRRVISLLKEVMNSSKTILPSNENAIRVKEFADSSVNLTYRAWCKTEDYWDTYFDSMEAIKEILDREKIEIPFPQLDLHMKSK